MKESKIVYSRGFGKEWLSDRSDFYFLVFVPLSLKMLYNTVKSGPIAALALGQKEKKPLNSPELP
jgi:hypothetical protein